MLRPSALLLADERERERELEGWLSVLLTTFPFCSTIYAFYLQGWAFYGRLFFSLYKVYHSTSSRAGTSPTKKREKELMTLLGACNYWIVSAY